MGELFANFSADSAKGPEWIGIWMNVMVAGLAIGLPFLFIRKEARWTWLFIFIGMAGVLTTYHFSGYTRLMGIGHVIGWTPALIYLWSQRGSWDIRGSWFGKWAVLASVIMAVSLVFDYADVIRWIMGERAALV